MTPFFNRLREIHLSGYNKYHAPFAQTEVVVKEKILGALNRVLSSLSVPEKIPIIIENNCKTVKEAKDDYGFVVDYIKKNRF